MYRLSSQRLGAGGDGFGQLTFLLENPKLHGHAPSMWNISVSYEGFMDSPRVDHWNFLMVHVLKRGNIYDKKSIAPTGVVLFFWSISVLNRHHSTLCQASAGTAVTTSLPKWVAAAPSPSFLMFLGMFFFLCHLGWSWMRPRGFQDVCWEVSGFGSSGPFIQKGPDFERGEFSAIFFTFYHS